ncbi:hypothetical protein V6N13_048520 [Hibiscus sabdariffa]
MHLPFFWWWLQWWCEPMVCLLPLGVPPPCLGSPSTWLSLSLYVDRGVARHAWLAAPVHGFLEGPRMGPCSFPLYLGFLLTTCGTSIGGYGKYVLSLVSPRCPACSCSPCALISLRSCVRLCGHCVAEFWTAAVLLRSGLHARLAGSLATVLGPSRGLLVYSVTQWLGVQVEGQKLQYGAWMRAPQTKQPAASRPRGRVSLVDDADVAVPTPSAASGSSTGVPPTKEASSPPASTTAMSSGVGNGSATAPLSTGPPPSPVPAS